MTGPLSLQDDEGYHYPIRLAKIHHDEREKIHLKKSMLEHSFVVGEYTIHSEQATSGAHRLRSWYFNKRAEYTSAIVRETQARPQIR